MGQATVNHVTLNYRFDGARDGPVIALSNSLASNLTMWDHQVPALTGAGWRVLRYDSRGHGGSGVTRGPFTIGLLVDDVVALLDHLGLDRVAFMGCSMGGMVGQMLATVHGDRLDALVLTSTAAYTGAPEIWDQRIDAVTGGGMEAVADATIDRWFTKPGQQRLAAEVARIRAMVAATPPGGFTACCAAIRDMDQRESIRAIATPTLVLVGEEDPSTPVEAARLIHERIDGSRLEVIPDGAHFVNVEQADAFNAAVLRFLAGVA